MKKKKKKKCIFFISTRLAATDVTHNYILCNIQYSVYTGNIKVTG